MPPRTRYLMLSHALIACFAAIGCSDKITQVVAPEPALDSVRVTASVRWNQRAVALIVARPPASNGQAAVSRILTYLSLAQYRAVLAADAAKTQAKPPSLAAAVGGASVAVLNSFFALDVATNESQLNVDLSVPPWPATRNEDVVAGEALGRKIGAEVLTLAASDNYLVKSPGTPPTGTGMWVSAAGTGIVRSLHGARPFFLTDAAQLRSPPPPAFGSAQFTTALSEVRSISDARSAQQLAIANYWNTSSGPFTAGALNLLADDIIREHSAGEKEAARILAFANAAAFDAQIACFDSKFAYWYIRPSQADPAITLPIGLPNHPSYPSGHSCITSAIMAVVADAFPSEKARADGYISEAGMSRVYGGIHYRFDVEAGQNIGRAAAALALKGSLK